MIEWQVDVNRFFVETGAKNKKGKPIKVPVTVRKLHLTGDFIWTNRYCITLVNRQGEQWYSVKEVIVPKKNRFFTVPQLKVVPVKMKWKKEGNYDMAGIIKWLTLRIGYANANSAVSNLLTAPPQNLAA